MAISKEKSDFARRLNELCTEQELPERGRQSALATKFHVTPNAARKWLLGLGLPELEVAIRMADWAKVNVEWLLTGRGPKRGHLVETKALVVAEALQSLPAEERAATLDYIKYKLDRAGALFTGEKLKRYKDALDRFGQPPEQDSDKR